VRIVGLERVRALEGPLILLAPHFVGLDAAAPDSPAISTWRGSTQNRKTLSSTPSFSRGEPASGISSRFPARKGAPGARRAEGRIPFYYLPDQDYGPRDAIFVPFFAASAATITGCRA